MIDIEKAADIIRRKFPGVDIKAAYEYKGNCYLFIAKPDKKDAINPFYLVNMTNGYYRQLNPTEDMKAFGEATRKPPLKKFRKGA